MIVNDDYIDRALDFINDEPIKALNLAQYKLYKRPKLRLNRLIDDKKLVPIVVIFIFSVFNISFNIIIHKKLDVQINDKLIIRERFDWNLNHENISVKDFSELYVERLNLPPSNATSIRIQILTQVFSYIFFK